MSKLAFVFPGQGSQHVGMGLELYKDHEAARKVFERTDAVLGERLSGVLFNGPEGELVLTANAQPAILTHSIAALRLLEDEGIRPDVVAGHSLGEYSAVVAARGLRLESAVPAVRLRGALMQEAVPIGVGTMAALIGLDQEQVEEIVERAAEDEVLAMANINSPMQIVVAGHVGAIDRAVELANDAGAKRAMRLNVSAPFHCSLMQSAQDGMRTHLTSLTFGDLAMPLINNADAAEVTAADEVREGLVRQIVSPVRWLDTMRRMIDGGVDTVVEIGPGRVLSGLLKRTDRSLALFNVEDNASLEKTISELKG